MSNVAGNDTVGSLADDQELLPYDHPTSEPLSHSHHNVTSTEFDGNIPTSDLERPVSEDLREQSVSEDEGTNSHRRCGCVTAIDKHLENFTTFQSQVRDGLKNLKSRDVRYDDIEVLMVYWKGGDVPEVAAKAKELGDLFETEPYSFKVTPHEIDFQNLDQKKINRSFSDALQDARRRIGSPETDTISNLFILYYGGHGAVDGSDRLWTPRKSSVKNLIWSNHQTQMYDFDCDVLYLFDCCYSLAMVETPSTKSIHSRRCEIFCSSGLKERSGAQDKTLFTGALRQFLADKRNRILEGKDALGGLTFESICDAMTKPEILRTLIAEPRSRLVSPNPVFRGRITLSRQFGFVEPPPQQDGSDSGYGSEIESRSNLSDTRVLIKIKLRNPAEGLSADEWLAWFEQRPNNVANIDIAVVKKIEWVGIFESTSSLALITIPLWLWHNMEPNPACQSLGIVRSKNLLRMPIDRVDSLGPVLSKAFIDKLVQTEQPQEVLVIPTISLSKASATPRAVTSSADVLPMAPKVASKPDSLAPFNQIFDGVLVDSVVQTDPKPKILSFSPVPLARMQIDPRGPNPSHSLTDKLIQTEARPEILSFSPVPISKVSVMPLTPPPVPKNAGKSTRITSRSDYPTTRIASLRLVEDNFVHKRLAQTLSDGSTKDLVQRRIRKVG